MSSGKHTTSNPSVLDEDALVASAPAPDSHARSAEAILTKGKLSRDKYSRLIHDNQNYYYHNRDIADGSDEVGTESSSPTGKRKTNETSPDGTPTSASSSSSVRKDAEGTRKKAKAVQGKANAVEVNSQKVEKALEPPTIQEVKTVGTQVESPTSVATRPHSSNDF